MKHLVIVLFLFVTAFVAPAYAQNPEKKGGLDWYTDLAKAQELSKATHKPIFGFFTGSDWCGWCHKLQNDVMGKPAFVKWAKEKVILLELDFPKRKQLTPELTQQNNGLQQAFQVQGYPTVWIFTMDHDAATNKMNITPYGSLGYPQQAVQGKEEVKFLADANAILAKSKAN